MSDSEDEPMLPERSPRILSYLHTRMEHHPAAEAHLKNMDRTLTVKGNLKITVEKQMFYSQALQIVKDILTSKSKSLSVFYFFIFI